MRMITQVHKLKTAVQKVLLLCDCSCEPLLSPLSSVSRISKYSRQRYTGSTQDLNMKYCPENENRFDYFSKKVLLNLKLLKRPSFLQLSS
mmetsp:Transcript_27857/g.39151  ORF Transcript_27857/g.39151 Transcript_27857/m.39151 type:complete len:90 (-) Transcript_27857:10-279(-)